MRYRTKPVEVEAVKVDDVLVIHQRGSNDDWDTLPDWIREPAEMADGSVVIGAAVIRINMPGSRLGARQAEAGQWLVHQNGEIFVFKSGVFEALYELVLER